MTNNLFIVGSGKNNLIDVNQGKYLFVNSAIMRADTTDPIDVVITQGLLSTDEELSNAKNAEGLGGKGSLLMRSSKREALINKSINKLYVVTNTSENHVKDRLLDLGVDYRSLKCVSRKYVARRMLLTCIQSFEYNMDFLRLFLWTALLAIFDITIPSKYRPSTGGIAILIAVCEVKKNGGRIKLDGIGSSSVDAYYPSVEGGLELYKFNNIHQLADGLIISKNKGTFILS